MINIILHIKHKINIFIFNISKIGIDNDNELFHRQINLNNILWFAYSILMLSSSILSFYFNISNYVIIVLLAFFFNLITIVLSYKKLHLISRIFLILNITILIFVLSTIYGEDSRIILFYLPLILHVFLVFKNSELKYILVLISLILILLLTYTYNYDFFKNYSTLNEYGKKIHLITFPSLIILLCILMYTTLKNSFSLDKSILYQRLYYEKIINTLPIEIIVMDEQFKYQFINKAAVSDENLRNWLIGKDDYDYVELRNKEEVIADKRFEFYNKAKQSKNILNIEEIIYTPEGNKKYTEKTLLYIDDDILGDKFRYIGYSLDTTAKKETELKLNEYMLKLEKSNEELKQFAYITSHDLKSPLRNINSLLQLIRKKNENLLNTDSKDLIDSCIKSASYLYNIVSDVLLYTTSEMDISNFVIIDINETINEVLKNIDSIIKEKNATIVFDKKFPKIFSNRTMMFNLFSNLIQNGIKYNKSIIPTVTIDYTENEDYYNFSISDNGIGIDEKYKEQIFIVFKRLHNQSEYEGTGIGLSICKQIVENLGGNISVISKLGEGSTFYFNLPKSIQ